MSDKPIVIETKDGVQHGVDAYDDRVKRLYPQARIVRYQDGTPHPAALKREAAEDEAEKTTPPKKGKE